MYYKPIIFAAVFAVALAHHEETSDLRAIAFINSLERPLSITGNITFHQHPDGKVHVTGNIFAPELGPDAQTGLGFHVHEKGDITGGCLSTGAHFNPEHKQHGHPNDEDRHVGDLGNIVFDENKYAHFDFVDSQISLTGPHSILGRAVVLHERADDFGRTKHPDSKKTGNAGGRIACGVIGLLSPTVPWPSEIKTSLLKSQNNLSPNISFATSLMILSLISVSIL